MLKTSKYAAYCCINDHTKYIYIYINHTKHHQHTGKDWKRPSGYKKGKIWLKFFFFIFFFYLSIQLYACILMIYIFDSEWLVALHVKELYQQCKMKLNTRKTSHGIKIKTNKIHKIIHVVNIFFFILFEYVEDL